MAREDYISDVCVFAFSYIKYDYIANDEFKFVLQSSPYVLLNIENIQILRGRFFHGASCGADLMILLMLMLLLAALVYSVLCS